ncbi:MAG: class I SAM-dependent RNA methyltransferase [Acidimicrobiales bacterium]|nr:class I SAM-dependent RNA methyltransferase [Acidimicrobiales bacterium]MCB1259042.1 class I SAM-dependent RNA methyltransferase [Acidimicrobiales bacterium]
MPAPAAPPPSADRPEGDATTASVVGDVVELEVSAIVAGGDGLARSSDGVVVFVPDALPGERVRAEIVERKARHTRARVVEVLVPSVDRVVPPCRFVEAGCGGCDLQHAAPDAQRRLKAAVVADALRRLGGIDDVAVALGPVLPTHGFRTTVRAAVRDGRTGFRRRRSHDVLVVDDCLVAHPLAADVLGGTFAGADEVTVRVAPATGERLALVAPHAGGVQVPDDVVVVGADALARGRRAVVHDEVAGRRFRISAGSFFQSRADGAAALVDEVLAAGGDELATARTVADLYGGVGLFGAVIGALPHRPRVVLVERSRSSCADAAVNLADLDAVVQRRPVERWRPVPADVVVADPARAGLGRPGVDVVTATGAAVVVLVSCDAAALGRDAGLLVDASYRLEQVTTVDLFPHTHHVEVVTRFVRR